VRFCVFLLFSNSFRWGGHYAQFFSCCTACSGCGFAFVLFVAVPSHGGDATSILEVLHGMQCVRFCVLLFCSGSFEWVGHYAQIFSRCTACSGCGFEERDVNDEIMGRRDVDAKRLHWLTCRR